MINGSCSYTFAKQLNASLGVGYNDVRGTNSGVGSNFLKGAVTSSAPFINDHKLRLYELNGALN